MHLRPTVSSPGLDSGPPQGRVLGELGGPWLAELPRALRTLRTHRHGYLLPGMRIRQHNATHDTHDTLVEHRFHKLHDALVERRFLFGGWGAGAGATL